VGAAEGVAVSHRPIDAGSYAAIKQALARRIPAPADAVKRLRDFAEDPRSLGCQMTSGPLPWGRRLGRQTVSPI